MQFIKDILFIDFFPSIISLLDSTFNPTTILGIKTLIVQFWEQTISFFQPNYILNVHQLNILANWVYIIWIVLSFILIFAIEYFLFKERFKIMRTLFFDYLKSLFILIKMLCNS